MATAEPKLAVALRYDPARDVAPAVTAKGSALLAQRIETMAREAGIAVHVDKGLATILSRLEPASPIPPALFAAVAEILAHLHGLDRALRRSDHA